MEYAFQPATPTQTDIESQVVLWIKFDCSGCRGSRMVQATTAAHTILALFPCPCGQSRRFRRNSSSCAAPLGPLRILFAHLLSGAVAAGVSGVEGVCKSCWVPALWPAETQARHRCTFQCSRGSFPIERDGKRCLVRGAQLRSVLLASSFIRVIACLAVVYTTPSPVRCAHTHLPSSG